MSISVLKMSVRNKNVKNANEHSNGGTVSGSFQSMQKEPFETLTIR